MADTKNMVLAFAKKYRKKTGYDMTICWGKDCTIMKRLLKTDDQESLLHLMNVFFENNDTYLSLGNFAYQINNIKCLAARKATSADFTTQLPKFDKYGNYIE